MRPTSQFSAATSPAWKWRREPKASIVATSAVRLLCVTCATQDWMSGSGCTAARVPPPALEPPRLRGPGANTAGRIGARPLTWRKAPWQLKIGAPPAAPLGTACTCSTGGTPGATGLLHSTRPWRSGAFVTPWSCGLTTTRRSPSSSSGQHHRVGGQVELGAADDPAAEVLVHVAGRDPGVAQREVLAVGEGPPSPAPGPGVRAAGSVRREAWLVREPGELDRKRGGAAPGQGAAPEGGATGWSTAAAASRTRCRSCARPPRGRRCPCWRCWAPEYRPKRCRAGRSCPAPARSPASRGRRCGRRPPDPRSTG